VLKAYAAKQTIELLRAFHKGTPWFMMQSTHTRLHTHTCRDAATHPLLFTTVQRSRLLHINKARTAAAQRHSHIPALQLVTHEMLREMPQQRQWNEPHRLAS
jgi:hypothetical protein